MKLVTEFYWYENNKVYADVPYITLKGVWDDAEAVMQLECGTNSECDITEKEYPVSGEIAQLIVQSILQVDYGQPRKDKEQEHEVEVKPH